MADPPPGRRRRGHPPRRRRDPRREAPAHHRRRRRPLRLRQRRARQIRRADRHPRGQHPGRRRRPALGPQVLPRRHRLHRHDGGQRHRRRGGPDHRHRHPLRGLHHRVPDRVPEPGRDVHQHQRRRDRRVQARHLPADRRRRPQGPGETEPGPGRLPDRRRPGTADRGREDPLGRHRGRGLRYPLHPAAGAERDHRRHAAARWTPRT